MTFDINVWDELMIGGINECDETGINLIKASLGR